MGRPSQKHERASEILDAFEACVARYGIEGATLDRVAEKAGIARPLIRHNVGNRDDLLAAFIQRFFAKADKDLQGLVSGMAEQRSGDELVEYLLDGSASEQHSVLIVEALIAAGAEMPELAAQVRQWLSTFIRALMGVFTQKYPQANDEAIKAVATGITAIRFNADSFEMLGEMEAFRLDSKRAAHILIGALSK